MLIKDIPKHLVLVTDSRDIDAIADIEGVDLGDYGCLFVEVLDGEYGTIYGCSGIIPYLMGTAYLIKNRG
jgi:hypothetical protein